MEFIKNNTRIIVIGLLIVALIIILAVANANNEDETNNTSSVETSEQTNQDQPDAEDSEPARVLPQINLALPQPSTKSEVVSSEKSLLIVAEAGDNQSEMARKVVAAHLESVDKNLQPGQLLFMETILVKEAGNNDSIPVGSEIQVDTDRLNELTAQAEELSETRIAAWESYL